MKGDAVSTLKISGGPKHQYISGNVTVTDGSLKVNYTQCKYNFTNETIISIPVSLTLALYNLKISSTTRERLVAKFTTKIFLMSFHLIM